MQGKEDNVEAKQEVSFVQEDEGDEHILLMVTKKSNDCESHSCFLDIGYSNHIIGRK